MRTQIIIPLIIGLSVCGLGSVFIYHYLNDKRKDATEDEDDTDSTTSDLPFEVISTKELMVPNEFVPIIVGKHNLSLRSLEGKTKTKIDFVADPQTEDHQVCRVKGTQEAVQDASRIISQIIASKPAVITEELEVTQSACTKIIGRCGDKLQDICRKSNAKVSVTSSSSGDQTHRKVFITGTRVQVNAARALLEEKIQEDHDLRKAIEESELKRERRGPLKSLSDSQTSLTESMTSSKAERLNGAQIAGPSQMEVYVSAIASPSRFWLQIIGSQSTELDSLIETMSEYYDRPENQELHVIEEPYLDQIVAAMFKWDNKWYRAKIVAILPNEYNEANMVMDIYFLDYGDSAYVSPHEVFQLRPDFLTLRFQAIECFLANIAPLDYREQDAAIKMERSAHLKEDEEEEEDAAPVQRFKWDRMAIERFEQLTHVAQWEMLLCRVLCHEDKNKGRKCTDGRQERYLMGREGSPVPGVELYDPLNGREINIGQQLIQEGLAVPTTYQKGGGARLTVNGNGSQNSSRTLSPVGFGNGCVGRSKDGLVGRFSALCENSSNENFENASYERQ